MDKTIRRFDSFEAMKAEEYAYWQSRPAHERIAAVSELTSALYSMKGLPIDAQRLERTIVHLQRPRR